MDNFNLKYFLTENKLTLVSRLLHESKQVGNLYHFTRLELLSEILKEKKLKPSNARLEQNGFISFTRDFSNSIGSAKNVRLTFDGDLMSNKYKIIPYNQISPETDKEKQEEKDGEWENFGKSPNKQYENESIIPSKLYGGYINIYPYLKSIEIIKPWRWKENKWDDFKKEIKTYTGEVPIKFYPSDINWIRKVYNPWPSNKKLEPGTGLMLK
jgi:hypothetical protein